MSPSAQIVRFYYDFSSPFAYLGATQIARVAQEQGAAVEWKPILLGALFRDIGTPMVPLFEMSPVKQDYIRRDLQHWAAHWQVPIAWPSRFPMRTIVPLRFVIAAGPEHAPLLSLALFRAYWADDRDIAHPDVVRAIATEVGLPSEMIDRGLDPAPAIKQQLIDHGKQAIADGCCGVPSFVVREHLFWGQDRLDLVARTLAGWEPPR